MRRQHTDRSGVTTVAYTGDLETERAERLADLSVAADAVIDARYSAPVREGLLMRASYLNAIVSGLIDGQPRALTQDEQQTLAQCLTAQAWIVGVRTAEAAARAWLDAATELEQLDAAEARPQWPE